MPCAVCGAVCIVYTSCVHKRGFSSARCDRRPQLLQTLHCRALATRNTRSCIARPALYRKAHTRPGRSALRTLCNSTLRSAPPAPLLPARARARPPPPRFAASAACSTIESAAGRPRPVPGRARRCTREVGNPWNAGLGLLQSTCAEWRRAATCKRGVRALDNILADLPTRAAMTRGAGGAAKARGGAGRPRIGMHLRNFRGER